MKSYVIMYTNTSLKMFYTSFLLLKHITCILVHIYIDTSL